MIDLLPRAQSNAHCSTSYHCSHSLGGLLPTHSQTCLRKHLYKRSFNGQNLRQDVRGHMQCRGAVRSLNIEARRRRPSDPIIPPYITQDKGNGYEDYTDMMSHLFKNRIMFVGSRITDDIATNVVAKLMALEAIDDKKDIKLYINSAGGSAYAIIGMIDAIKYLKPDVSTICMGCCASTSTLLLAAGTKGKRFSLANSRIMIHQPVGGAMGSADEVNITTTELNRTMQVVNKFYSEFTGLSIERIEEETDRDKFMSPQEAIEMGLIDAIIE